MSVLLATSGPSAFWYLTRGTGVVALLLLTVGLVLGVLGPIRFRTPRWPQFLIAGAHRSVTLLAVVFVAVHVLTTVADGYSPIGLLDAFVPFRSPYRPLWLGFGAVAFDLLLALVVTSLLRGLVGLRAWRAVHWLAYACWPVALLHSLGTGSDVRSSWLLALAAVCTASVAAAVLWRVVVRPEGAGLVRVAAGLAAVVVPVLGLLWLRAGPLRPGWAVRAGTPGTLLASARVLPVASVASPVPQTSGLPNASFAASLSGRFAQSGPDANGLVSVALAAVTRGSLTAHLRIDLWGQPSGGGGVVMTASRVRFGPIDQPNAYTGRITGLQGNRVVVSVSDAAGQQRSVALVLGIDASAGTISGTLRASAVSG